MKSFIVALILIIGFSNLSAQTTHIVDNNASGIGDFIKLSDAISAAASGDIILLVPSPTTYGDLSLTSTGKQLTIAGGGFNGSTGMITKLGAISLNGGSAGNTDLDEFVLGGFECKSIDVKFVDSVKIKAVKTTEVISSTNYELRVVSSVGAEIEYVTTGNALFTSNHEFKVFHSVFIEKVNTTGVEIQTTNGFIFSNSFIGYGTGNDNHLLLIDESTSGNFNNNVIYKLTGGWKRIDFGGAVTVTNNIIFDPTYYYFEVKNGQKFLNNTFYLAGGLQYLTISDGILDVDGNKFENPTIPITNYTTGFILKPTDGSPVIDSGSGNDFDGTVADRGVYGGLDPMPDVLPTNAVGASVVPSITNMSLSLPTAVTGGKVILNVSGQSKKN